MSREVPEGWSVKRLGEVMEFQNGFAFKPADWGSSGLPIVRIQNLNGGGDFNFYDGYVPAQFGIKSGDILFCWSGSRGTSFGPRRWKGSQGWLNQHIFRCDLRSGIYGDFAFHLLEHLTEAIEQAAHGGAGLVHIKKSELVKFEAAMPPLDEQRRIAEILSSADDAIAATRAVIEQTRKVKQTALDSLFHRGDWSDDELPIGHQLLRLEDLAQRGSGHTPSKKFTEYWNGGIPWISLQDTKALDRRFVRKTAAEISELGIKNSSAELHPAGTVFVSRDATVGKVGIMQIPMAVSQHFIAWTCGPSLNNIFLYYWLLNMRSIFNRIAAGSTIKTIGLPFFKELLIPVPDIATQQRIAAEMMSLDDSIDANEASLAELVSLKDALMSDLLTGRKRVTDALPMAAE